jgi:hypothetical protein
LRVCKRWQHSFYAFLKDMGECPKGMSLDRINNDLGYSPGNCRWATRRQQQQNKHDNVMVKYRGETLCVTEAARRAGFNADTILKRMYRGWPNRKLFMPLKQISWHHQ